MKLSEDEQRYLNCLAQNMSFEEMAVELGVSPRTVRRKLELIRRMWEREVR